MRQLNPASGVFSSGCSLVHFWPITIPSLGNKALAERPDLVWPTERVTAQMAAEELAGMNPPLVLDIRNPREWQTKHIARSVNIPLNHLQERIAEVPRDRRIAVHCAGGYRSSIAASILHHHGITNLIELAGGLAAWDAAQLPVVEEQHGGAQ